MEGQRDTDWGRSNPRSQGAELVVLAIAVCVSVWAMFDAVSYAREIGRPLGIVGFVALFFRESIVLGLVTLGAAALVLAGIHQAIVRLWRRILGNGSDPTSEG